MVVVSRAGRAATRADPPKLVSPPTRPLPWPIQFYRSAIGKKWIMALTGVMLIGFVIFHALGNLKMYIGPESIDHYGEALRDLGGDLVPRTHLLWILRIGLIAAFALHIVSSFSLTRLNWRARPTRYQAARDYQSVTFASRSMRWTSYIVLIYLFTHLADLTWGWFNPGFERGAIYRNVDASLSRWWMAAIYAVANTALAVHLYHGVYSMVQSLGITNPRIQAVRRPAGVAVAAFVFVVNVSFPIAVLAGIVELPGV